MSEQVKEFWKSGISIHSIARIIHWSNLEGTSRFLVQTPARSRANFNVRSGCSGPPVKVWKSANMEIRCLSGLLLLVFNNSRGRIFSFCPASVFHRNRWWLPLIHSLCTSERSLAPFFPLTLLDGHRQQKNPLFSAGWTNPITAASSSMLCASKAPPPWALSTGLAPVRFLSHTRTGMYLSCRGAPKTPCATPDAASQVHSHLPWPAGYDPANIGVGTSK